MVRPKKCKSYVMARLLNVFGERGGFDKILARISNKDNPIPLELLLYYMDCLGSAFPLYHRSFAQEYIPKLQAAVELSILNAPEQSIRNVRKERIDGIVKNLDYLLRRVYVYEEKIKAVEKLNLDIALMCLKASFLERRIQGIKILNDIIKGLRMYGSKAFKPEFIVEWSRQHGVLEAIFGPKTYHIELIKRSNELIRLLTAEEKITKDELELFWSASKYVALY